MTKTPGQLDLQDFPVQEQQRTQRLGTGGASDLPFIVEAGKKSANFFGSHILGMPESVKTEVPSCPVDICPLGTEAVMLVAHGATQLIERFRLPFW
jgi:hypothetical protein